jgi:cyclase
MADDLTPDVLRRGAAELVEPADGVFAYVQPDGSWWINNAGFVTDGTSAVVIDTCATEQRTRDLQSVVRWATGGAVVRTVVNTHHHGDHSFGNCLFDRATVVAHERSRTALVEYGEPPVLTSWNPVEWGAVRMRPADVTFHDRATVWAGDRRCEVLFVGETAHTVGDCVVWLPDAGVLFSGDLLFHGGTPFVVSGSVAGLRRVLTDFVRRLAPRVIVPGHGPVGDQSMVHDTVEYLDLVRRSAAFGHTRGWTPLETAYEVDLGRFAAWTDPERLVGNLHRAYAELGASPGVDEAAALADMVTFNGGTPLHTHV